LKNLYKDDLDKLPRKYGIGANSNKKVIDWGNCINYKIGFIYDNIVGEVKILSYDPKKCALTIEYLNSKPFYIVANSLLKCYLGKLLEKHTSEFKISIGETFKDNKRDLLIIDREFRDNPNNKGKFLKWYQYKCNKCGYENGWIVESNLFSGIGCACCGSNLKTVVEDINDIPTTAPWMVKYFQGSYDEAKLYTKSSASKIYPICPDCGRIKDKLIKICNIHIRHSINCPCGDGQSYPNKFMFALLEQQVNICFEAEYSPYWIKPKRYDFYFYFKLNDIEYIIEMDGKWHKKDNGLSGQTKEESKFIDDEKDRLAKEHGINVIRINCEESTLEQIKNNIIKSKLCVLFDLSKVDWLKCEEFATSNLCKKVCDIKNTNPYMTVNEISKITKLERSTIINYLNKGTTLKWCNYNGKEESKRGSSKSGLVNGKQVEVYKDGHFLGIFKSSADLERNSEVIFNTKLFQANISKVCLGVRKHHKGYTFRYAEEVVSNV